IAAVAAVPLLPSAGGASRGPGHVQVVEKEYTLVLSRLVVADGATTLEVVNFGMDAHDLALRRDIAGARTISFAPLEPNGRKSLTLRLAPGHYTMWCTLPGHRRRGMVAPLVVR